jgi:NADPH:quinone reductase-like Zn-dependent oxidoreductase
MVAIEDNQAAYLLGVNVKPLEVRPGPDQTKPEADEVIIQVGAAAINPADVLVSLQKPNGAEMALKQN